MLQPGGPAPVPVEQVLATIRAAMSHVKEEREPAELILRTWENDAAPGFLHSLMLIVQQQQAIDEVGLGPFLGFGVEILWSKYATSLVDGQHAAWMPEAGDCQLQLLIQKQYSWCGRAPRWQPQKLQARATFAVTQQQQEHKQVVHCWHALKFPLPRPSPSGLLLRAVHSFSCTTVAEQPLHTPTATGFCPCADGPHSGQHGLWAAQPLLSSSPPF